MYARWITGILLVALVSAAGCRGVAPHGGANRTLFGRSQPTQTPRESGGTGHGGPGRGIHHGHGIHSSLGIHHGLRDHHGLLPANHLPPTQQLLEPGPGVGGPGPGVLPAQFGAATTAVARQPLQMVQVMFGRPEGMQIRWDVSGVGKYDSEPLICPGRQNFRQGGMYGLRVTNIEGKEGAELYPTIEIGPSTPRTAAYLAHNAIPIQFTPEDFDQVMAGNYVTKVIYLPDPEFQELAIAVDTLVSTRLDPGVDPIVEADRRGAILAIIRMGNIDKRMPLEQNGAGPGAEAVPAAYRAAATAFAPTPMTPLPYTHGGNIPNYVSGITAPYYGMPMSGTPIGLPGAPHLPHGFPAGLQRHMMTNHTRMYIPEPTQQLQFHVQQSPGYSYPAPADRVYVKEQIMMPQNNNRQPPANMMFGVPSRGGHPYGCGCPYCRARAAAANGNGANIANGVNVANGANGN